MPMQMRVWKNTEEAEILHKGVFHILSGMDYVDLDNVDTDADVKNTSKC